MTRLRFTVRRMILAVAIVAVALEVKPTYERWAICSWKASWHANMAISLRNAIAERREPDGCTPREPVRLTPDRRVVLIQQAEAEEGLAVKYERGARYPWLPVEPDPESDP